MALRAIYFMSIILGDPVGLLHRQFADNNTYGGESLQVSGARQGPQHGGGGAGQPGQVEGNRGRLPELHQLLVISEIKIEITAPL